MVETILDGVEMIKISIQKFIVLLLLALWFIIIGQDNKNTLLILNGLNMIILLIKLIGEDILTEV